MTSANLPASFVADARGLDFLNSIATPVDEPVDWISDGAGLIDWLAQAGLVPAAELETVAASATPGELDRVAGQARDLRDWFRGFVTAHAGRPLGADALEELAPLNRLLERDETFDRIVAHADEHGHRHLALEQGRRWRSPESLLLPVCEAIARVVAEEDFTHIKGCEGHRCTLMFVDRTRAHARRWCSMSVCGNRAKVMAHRQRQRAG
ncbi:MAG TPA: ABATE domain-containing protein [Caulobacteraceae bacterium]|jgi:predicted RNA-binding Zn ribbon-like protein|nr:ABATE domain-containing protein [Caulobacteraceae bacterium]